MFYAFLNALGNFIKLTQLKHFLFLFDYAQTPTIAKNCFPGAFLLLFKKNRSNGIYTVNQIVTNSKEHKNLPYWQPYMTKTACFSPKMTIFFTQWSVLKIQTRRALFFRRACSYENRPTSNCQKQRALALFSTFRKLTKRKHFDKFTFILKFHISYKQSIHTIGCLLTAMLMFILCFRKHELHFSGNNNGEKR